MTFLLTFQQDNFYTSLLGLHVFRKNHD